MKSKSQADYSVSICEQFLFVQMLYQLKSVAFIYIFTCVFININSSEMSFGTDLRSDHLSSKINKGVAWELTLW